MSFSHRQCLHGRGTGRGICNGDVLGKEGLSVRVSKSDC